MKAGCTAKAAMDPRIRALLDAGVKPVIEMGESGPVKITIGPFVLTRHRRAYSGPA